MTPEHSGLSQDAKKQNPDRILLSVDQSAEDVPVLPQAHRMDLNGPVEVSAPYDSDSQVEFIAPGTYTLLCALVWTTDEDFYRAETGYLTFTIAPEAFPSGMAARPPGSHFGCVHSARAGDTGCQQPRGRP